jgi:hypothetical protein
MNNSGISQWIQVIIIYIYIYNYIYKIINIHANMHYA